MAPTARSARSTRPVHELPAPTATAARGTPPGAADIATLRAFNRFYTRRVGALRGDLLDTGFTLPHSRVLWELAHRGSTTAAELARELDLDPGYMSRLLRPLKQRRLVRSQPAPGDARRVLLSLSAAGQRAFAPLDERAQTQTREWLDALPPPSRTRLVDAVGTVHRLLDGGAEDAPVTLRAPVAGDLGWVVERHGALYAGEFGWDWRFEALVARIVADLIDRFDTRHEAAWIAARGDERLGFVALVQARDDDTGEPMPGVAQLRLLLVEPHARGLGLGKRLTAECEAFARAAGYHRIRLWTNSILLAARGIYQAAGYRLIGKERHRSFGHALVGEVWDKPLEAAPATPAVAAPKTTRPTARGAAKPATTNGTKTTTRTKRTPR